MGLEDSEEPTEIQCHLGALLDERSMTLVELSEKVNISVVNLSVLKNNHAKAMRFSTLQAICKALDCEVGELLSYVPRLP
ncbi:helix-turn-helix domain-containing protein [Paeniglutamicibacter sp. NPDC012692]|uniref:helix-turn-helix domain-containing protein n=1 Tax=Paeniglutamicibacter sp. NPDC012692 TaxID=3364388 RepID=UPI0036CAE45C